MSLFDPEINGDKNIYNFLMPIKINKLSLYTKKIEWNEIGVKSESS